VCYKFVLFGLSVNGYVHLLLVIVIFVTDQHTSSEEYAVSQ